MKRFLIWFFTILGLIALSVVVVLVGPLIGLTLLWQIVIIAAIWLIAFTIWFVGWLIRRRNARKLEEEVAGPADDTPILRDKMKDAMETLKRTSGRSGSAYLYDLPWYIIIGPPGSGKTTALVNSGLKFPLAGPDGARAIAGVGGTRHCDWWFTEDAVMIDTAGRYTTQASDARADSKSWEGFLDMLSDTRPRQPINGVLIYISVEDIMTLNPGELDAHANAVRMRLDELHKKLKIAFPVYLVFTKTDLVAGFMEFFGNLSDDQSAMVWGATFRPKKKDDNMVTQFGAEYDELLTALSDQVTDRMQQVPDPRARSRVFAFPSQMASLKGPINDFLTKVFEPSRYRVDVALRGVYFTSGTQEGNPIDRILGSLSRNFGAQGGAQPVMSGQGRSFFLTDLLQKVVFSESGWVSTNISHVRRMIFLKTATYVLLFLGVIGVGAAWAWSYMQNEQLLAQTEVAINDYRELAAKQLNEAKVGDDDIYSVLTPLDKLRNMPMGYSTREESIPVTQRLGLGQHNRLRAANIAAYRDALERLFLPRLIWRVEDQLNKNIGNEAFVYEALKVYMMLGGKQRMEADYVRLWMQRDWEQRYPGVSNAAGRQRLMAHLEVLLDEPSSAVPLNVPLIREAQQILARMPLADRVYTLMKLRAESAGYPPWIVAERAGNDAKVVFETHDGASVDQVKVPGFFTKDGFIFGFLAQIETIIEEVRSEKWVLGEAGKQATFEAQYKTLREDVMSLYRREFIDAWDQQLGRLKIAPVLSSLENLTVMSALSAPTSPLKQLMRSIRAETELTKMPPPPEGGAEGEAAEAGKDASVREADTQLRKAATGSAGRIGYAAAIAALRGAADGGAGGGDGATRPNYGVRIEEHFKSLHAFAGEVETEAAPVDTLVAHFNVLYQSLNDMRRGGTIRDQAGQRIMSEISLMDAEAPQLPGMIAAMTERPKATIKEFVLGSDLQQLRQALANEVTTPCEIIVRGKYPFQSNATSDVGLNDFARLFGPNGIMERFFNQRLAAMVDQSGSNWKWLGDTELSRNLSATTLRQFQRAAQIRDAFFASGALGIQFTITPVTLSPDALTVTFDADGQQVIYDHRAPRPVNMSWPGPSGGLVIVSVTPEIPGQQSRVKMTGTWALVRMMRRHAGLGSGGTMSLTFSIGGREASFTVQTQSVYNPFKMDALTEFTCPKGL